jgi:hypothetical protein
MNQGIPHGGPNSYGLPQPSSSGSVDLSGIKPVSSGTVSFADAMARARSKAAEMGANKDSRGPSGSSKFVCISVSLSEKLIEFAMSSSSTERVRLEINPTLSLPISIPRSSQRSVS